MSTVLISNNTATKFLGDKYGVMGRTDWKLLMDFSNDTHILNKNPITMSGLLTNTRATPAITYDSAGVPSMVGNNKPRLSYNAEGTVRGLLSERASRSYLSPSLNPVSGTVAVECLADEVLLLQCKGTGSVSISGAAIKKQTGLGTEDSPIAFTLNNTSGLSDVQLTVTGDISHANISTQVNDVWKSSLQITELAGGRAKPESNVVNLASVVTGTNWTVLVALTNNKSLENQEVVRPNAASNLPLLEIGNSTTHIAFARGHDVKFTSNDLRVRLFDNTEKALNIMTAFPKDFVVVGVTSFDGGFYVSYNGHTSERMASIPNFVPTKLNLGGSSWVPTLNAEACFSNLVVYDHAVSVQELTSLTLNSF